MSLRHRPTSLTDSHRRNSTLSDTVSEARNSIRSSTDDLFFPRVIKRPETESHQDDESLWQSAPLALALFPAIAGVFFHNGSAVVTDITLLVLAAIFLNWSVRLPWYVCPECMHAGSCFVSKIAPISVSYVVVTRLFQGLVSFGSGAPSAG